MRLSGVHLLLVLASAVAPGCGELPPTAPRRITGTSGTNTSTPTLLPSLIGKWSFTRLFYDDIGAAHLSQTVWWFAANGAATRTVYTDNLTAGVGDVIVTQGRWSSTPTVLSVVFDGSTTPNRYDYRFEGGALILAGTAFRPLAQ